MGDDPRRSLGALGERIAAAHMARSGYRVLGRNVRTRSGELDLIVSGRGCIVFCEVRARTGSRGVAAPEHGGPLESIGPLKRRRLRRLAREWLAARAGAPGELSRGADTLRFDAIGLILAPDGKLLSLEHVEDAF